MKFRYTGKKEIMTAFGYDFSGGQTPDVTDSNAIKRLSGNTYFTAVEEPKPIKTFGSKAKTAQIDEDKDFPPLPGARQ